MLLDARPERSVAVALHDIEPATFERCALMRDWLDDLGVDKVTLLVIPASDLHPFSDRSPALVDWLAERATRGDAIAQHGFQHRRLCRSPGTARASCTRRDRGRAAEFVGLDEAETRRAVDAGRRLLRLAGIEPRGFVAPAYAYTPALQRVLPRRFDWWASLHAVSYDAGGHPTRAPALGFGDANPLRQVVHGLRSRAPGGRVLRLDLHPADLEHPRRIAAVERTLRGARDRVARTYDELVPAPAAAG